jgi:hypothetical protein
VVVEVILGLDGFYFFGVEGVGLEEAVEELKGFLDVVAGAFKEADGFGERRFFLWEALEAFDGLGEEGRGVMGGLGELMKPLGEGSSVEVLMLNAAHLGL